MKNKLHRGIGVVVAVGVAVLFSVGLIPQIFTARSENQVFAPDQNGEEATVSLGSRSSQTAVVRDGGEGGDYFPGDTGTPNGIR